VKSKAPVIYLN